MKKFASGSAANCEQRAANEGFCNCEFKFQRPRCAGVYHSSPVVGHVSKEGFIAGDLLESLLFRSCRQIPDNDNDNR